MKAEKRGLPSKIPMNCGWDTVVTYRGSRRTPTFRAINGGIVRCGALFRQHELLHNRSVVEKLFGLREGKFGSLFHIRRICKFQINWGQLQKLLLWSNGIGFMPSAYSLSRLKQKNSAKYGRHNDTSLTRQNETGKTKQRKRKTRKQSTSLEINISSPNLWNPFYWKNISNVFWREFWWWACFPQKKKRDTKKRNRKQWNINIDFCEGRGNVGRQGENGEKLMLYQNRWWCS